MCAAAYCRFLVAALVPCHAAASQTEQPSEAGEIAALKSRIEELEAQNRPILQALGDLRARLNASSSAVMANAGGAPADVPAAAAQTSPTEAPEVTPTSAPVQWSEIVSNGNRIRLYGLLRLDTNIDSQRPNDAQSPLFITSKDPRGGNSGAGNFTMTPRLTRFGVDLSGPRVPALGNGKLTGELEIDFNNGGSESRPIIRIGHAYLRMNWDRFSILVGQTWDLFSPLSPTVNSTNLMWNAGNLGDRRPQFRLSYEPKAGDGTVSLAVGAGLTGTIDGQNLDADGYRDGETSGKPNVQARAGYSRALWVDGQPFTIGVGGICGWMNTTKPVGGRTDFHNQAVNIDYTLPLTGRMSLRGEVWWGRTLADVRGGAGQGIKVTNGRDIRTRGGWSELTIRALPIWTFHPGYTVDDPANGDILSGARTRNGAVYFGTRLRFSRNFMIGADYLRWKTSYKNLLGEQITG
jgi:hypothetical protein